MRAAHPRNPRNPRNPRPNILSSGDFSTNGNSDLLYRALVLIPVFTDVLSAPLWFSQDVRSVPVCRTVLLPDDILFSRAFFSCPEGIRGLASHAPCVQRHRGRSAFSAFLR